MAGHRAGQRLFHRLPRKIPTKVPVTPRPATDCDRHFVCPDRSQSSKASVVSQLGVHLAEEGAELAGEREAVHAQMRCYTLNGPILPIAKFQGLTKMGRSLPQHVLN